MVETVHSFVSETLALDGTDEVHSATRLERLGGRQGALRKPRPILVTFPYERQRERIIDAARQTIQNTTKRASRDYPSEIRNARGQLGAR